MPSTESKPVTDLLAQASASAGSGDRPGIGTFDLLQAILDEGAGLAAELLQELDLDPPEPAGEEADSEEYHLVEIARVAHQHAVIFESDRIDADHVLLAIVLVDKGVAAKRIGEEARGPIWDSLIAGFGYEDDILAMLSATGREAFALAWSQALAVGRETIEVEDLLRGISAPGWTKGARALAMLGRVPEWAPALWTLGVDSEPYRRIPCNERLRQALVGARESGAEAGLDYIGTEHLVLGISRADDGLDAFLGKGVSDGQVRDAVARAISSAEEARDAEARRRGWDPERDRDPDLVDRWLKGALEVGETTGEYRPDSGAELRCWPGLMAAILLNEDEDLADLLEDMLLQPKEAHGRAREAEDLPLSTAVAHAAEWRARSELEPVDLILATVATGSPRVLQGLDELGLTPGEVRAQLSEWRLRRDGDTLGAPSILAASGLNILFGAVTTVLLLQVVVNQGAWWKLIFLPLVWSGYPNYGPIGTTAVAAVLGFAISPLVGALHFLGIPADIVQARAERQEIWSRTGVRLNLREQRCVSRRTLGEIGRVNQGFRQMLRSSLPARLRPEARR